MGGFIGCMRQNYMRNIHWAAVVVGVLLLFAGCSKGGSYDFMEPGENYSYSDPQKGTSDDLAIGTVRSRDGVRYIRLDGQSCSQVMNPKEIADIKDGTRVFLQYRYVVASSIADFCTDAILVEWASPLEMGEIRYDMQARTGDPVDILMDWITSLEDGFLTLHYSIPASGSVKHGFSIYPGVETNTYRLVHEANGDSKGSLTDGIICFDVSGVLPDTEGKTVELHLDYIDLNKTKKRLTIEYQSPK